MGSLEEVEGSLMEWRARYNELFLVNWDATQNPGAALPPCLAVAAAYMNLTYEYVALTLFIKCDRG
jgi:hypothetical protein